MVCTTLNRHWHAQSEKYTDADSLLTALHNGWMMKKLVLQEQQRHSRLVNPYHIELERAGDIAEMIVIGNPYIHGFISAAYPQPALAIQ
jgi:hypothetical protein